MNPQCINLTRISKPTCFVEGFPVELMIMHEQNIFWLNWIKFWLSAFGLYGLGVCPAEAQVGIGTVSPKACAILDLTSEDRGLLLPRVTLDDLSKVGLNPQFEAAEGLFVYNLNDSLSGGRGPYIFDGASWRGLSYVFEESERWYYDPQGLKYWSGPVMIGASAATNNDLWISHKIIDWDNSNYFLDPGASSVLNELKLDPGSPVDVSLYWRASNTGFYAPAQGVLGLSIEGEARWLVDQQGKFGINTAQPMADLDLNGSIKIGPTGSIIQGVRRFNWEVQLPEQWSSTRVRMDLDGVALAQLNLPESVRIQCVIRGAIGAQVTIEHQWHDADGFHLELDGFTTELSGSLLSLDCLAFY